MNKILHYQEDMKHRWYQKTHVNDKLSQSSDISNPLEEPIVNCSGNHPMEKDISSSIAMSPQAVPNTKHRYFTPPASKKKSEWVSCAEDWNKIRGDKTKLLLWPAPFSVFAYKNKLFSIAQRLGSPPPPPKKKKKKKKKTRFHWTN